MLMNSVEDAMSTILRDQGIQTVHDEVVSEVAQRWAKAFRCKVTIKTGLEQNPWADPKQQSDIVGWYFSPRGNSMEWIAEVETEDSLSNPAVRMRWQHAAMPGIPMYLLIPKGNKAVAEKLAAAAGIQFTSVYEYSFFNGVVQIL
jgi:accessory colonization factor AcfC